MRRIAKFWTRLPLLLREHRVQLALSIRVTIAALVALALAQLLQLPLPLWAVLTAVIVTQMSVGRSLMATFDYLVGTLGGAIYGGAIGVLIPHSSEIALLAVLALAVTPLAFIAAINPRFSVAPITAIIVLLIPTITHVSPFTSALDRVIEVALGGVTGLVVSFLLLPASAHPQVVQAAARTLDAMAHALGELLAGLTQGLDVEALHRIQDGIGQALVHMNVVGAEAERERSTRLRRRARHRAAVAHASQVAPRPCDHRQSGDDPAARRPSCLGWKRHWRRSARPLPTTSVPAALRCRRGAVRRRSMPSNRRLMPMPPKSPRSGAKV